MEFLKDVWYLWFTRDFHGFQFTEAQKKIRIEKYIGARNIS